MNPNRSSFLQFCSVVTGFRTSTLEGTGLVDTYQELVESALGPRRADFYTMVDEVLSGETMAIREARVTTVAGGSDFYWPVVSALIRVWYLGYWSLDASWFQKAGLAVPEAGEPGSATVPSALAYTEQLSYLAAAAHPPGAKPTGFGGWSIEPVIDVTSL